MPEFDLKVTGLGVDAKPLQLGISEGCFVAIGAELDGEGQLEKDFGEGIILPSMIDAHVHFNEPGRAGWEGIASGSRALAAGGGTVFFDMPLNSSPPVICAESLLRKRAIAEEKSWTDFGLWGGLTPGSVHELPAMARAGAIGFKAFLCPSGLTEFPASDRRTLMEGARIAADLGLPIAVHAEVEAPDRPNPTESHYLSWCASRPISMEVAGIEMVLDAAAASGAAFHIVHVSSAEGLDLIHQAKQQGLNLTAETCPHYLLLNESIGARIGATAKCAPPLRSAREVEALWNRVELGCVDTIGSDHSPCPPEMKSHSDIFEVWGGIAGIQHGLPLLLSRDLDIHRLISEPVAERFKLGGKGGLRPGVDADFIVLESGSFPVDDDPPLTKHAHSPYLGMTSRYRIASTFLRGRPADRPGRGRFLQPSDS